MTGGINCPPVEATASMAAALCAGMPARFISGMVTMPVATTLATALPEIEPNRQEPSTAILAAPPRNRPISAIEMSVKNCMPPVFCNTWPNSRKAMTMVIATLTGKPRMPVQLAASASDSLRQSVLSPEPGR